MHDADLNCFLNFYALIKIVDCVNQEVSGEMELELCLEKGGIFKLQERDYRVLEPLMLGLGACAGQ